MRLWILWMFYKKTILAIAAIILIGLSILLIYPFVTGPTAKMKSNLINQTLSTILTNPEAETIFVSELEKDKCYWIASSYNGTDNIARIREYEYSKDRCEGNFLSESIVALDKPLNIGQGTDCLCSGDKYFLNRTEVGGKINIEISKRGWFG